MILVLFIYLFIRPSISVCISLVFRNLPKHHWKSSWEGNRLLSRVSHLILLLFIWMHVICCHSNHSLFSLECTQKSHLNLKTNAVTKSRTCAKMLSQAITPYVWGPHAYTCVCSHSWAKCSAVLGTKSLVSVRTFVWPKTHLIWYQLNLMWVNPVITSFQNLKINKSINQAWF